MKKTIFSVLLLGAAALTSCNMDEVKPGSIPDYESIQDVDDVLAFRNGLYSSFRALTSGTYITNTELQSDYYVGLVGNGNRGMLMNTGAITSSIEDVTEPYDGNYSVMKNVNFLLEKADEILQSGNLSDTELSDLKRYIAETRFIRGYMYYYLFDHYCQAYSADKAETPGLGLSIVTTYDPTGDTSKYPGRSTMKAVKDLIDADLAAAFTGLEEFEAANADSPNNPAVQNSSYISSYAVAALQARWALLTQDYATAMTKAQYVINSQKFPLCSGSAYSNIWTNDMGSELILVPFVDASESAYVGSFCDAWNYYANFPQRCDYIPTNATVSMYDEEKDVRFDSYFAGASLAIAGGAYDAYIMYKFPGNPALISGTNLYKNKPKPFRTSEQYLILAEAAQAIGQEAVANQALNTLRAARIKGYSDETNSGTGLRDAIRTERAKELIGEGFRISDLRRWGLGFTRDGSYPLAPDTENVIISSTVLSYSPNDFRYTWPIPNSEMEINPQLAGQQNPGY